MITSSKGFHSFILKHFINFGFGYFSILSLSNFYFSLPLLIKSKPLHRCLFPYNKNHFYGHKIKSYQYFQNFWETIYCVLQKLWVAHSLAFFPFPMIIFMFWTSTKTIFSLTAELLTTWIVAKRSQKHVASLCLSRFFFLFFRVVLLSTILHDWVKFVYKKDSFVCYIFQCFKYLCNLKHALLCLTSTPYELFS